MKNTDETLYHMMGVGEGIKALAWVSVGLQWRTDKKKTPVEWVQRCIELAEEDYFGGIYDGRADNDLNVRWAKSFIATITELLEYGSEHLTLSAAQELNRKLTQAMRLSCG
eukprot:m.409269 g.409269  ORF g.409269 m.409269 type:complete len:111 (+) comp21244_c1_seq6:1157-1489(+)